MFGTVNVAMAEESPDFLSVMVLLADTLRFEVLTTYCELVVLETALLLPPIASTVPPVM